QQERHDPVADAGRRLGHEALAIGGERTHGCSPNAGLSPGAALGCRGRITLEWAGAESDSFHFVLSFRFISSHSLRFISLHCRARVIPPATLTRNEMHRLPDPSPLRMGLTPPRLAGGAAGGTILPSRSIPFGSSVFSVTIVHEAPISRTARVSVG